LTKSLQLTVTGGIRHDPETIDVFFDENGTNPIQSFSFDKSNTTYYTFPPNYFNNSNTSVVTNQVFLKITPWSSYDIGLVELTFDGTPYN
jgi:hypothetical protein